MSTGAAPSTSPPGCPPPPTDLAIRKIPTCTLAVRATTFLRIHQTIYGSVFFTGRGVTDQVYRFDAPNDEFRVLYVSEHFEVCMAETIIRNNFNAAHPVLSRSYIESRSLATVTMPEQEQLNLVDLRQPLWPIGGSLEVTSTSDYTQPIAWSKAFYDLPADYDGIRFPSRYSGLDSIVLFDRVNVMEVSSHPLMSDTRLEPFLAKYGVKVA